ncbi:hypothetical protein JCGZ_17395 [Jatropha curcas]|uniref:RING-type E3 ubiquitin transferase n=1 Tax=Jatropha curcas TaxID=180498 RepID=A0A067LF03_JATCU|nr:RING-H2 finger protein ATL63 [Jatropha curcas]KDP45788.1 hypothetical protein JCGZ_17395 [Jatropha curcas]
MSSSPTHNPFSHLIKSISSYDTNIMLAALISLLVVILFVLLLHLYAKCLLERSRHRSRASSSISVSQILHPRPSSFHNFTTISSISSSPAKNGLDPSIISSIPLFVYREEEKEECLDCVICLSVFEENEICRRLKKCGHCFHVECIDMWLHFHSNCPICRAPAASSNEDGDCKMEIVIGTDTEEPNSDENENSNGSSSSSSCNSSMGYCSLKRMLSRTRSENKAFPSTNSVP